MTATSRTAGTRQTPNTVARSAWLFPGRTEMAIAVNWRQAAVDVMMRDLRLAREREEETDSIRIASFRRLSARCERALARCRTLAATQGC